MAPPQTLFATEASAAKLLDMKPAEFRSLVQEGHLPRGREIAPGVVRWRVQDLARIAAGEAAGGMEDVKW